MNMMYINGHKARVSYDPILETFRGEFIGTDHAASFMASDVKGLKVAAGDALEAYTRNCAAVGCTPFPPRATRLKRRWLNRLRWF